MSRHVCFDLETLSVQKDALILSIGCTTFHWDDDSGFDEYCDTGLFVKADPSAQTSRHCSMDTIEWWMSGKVSDAARDASFIDNPVGLAPKYLIRALATWARMHGLTEDTHWYCRGPHFDAAILEDFASQYGLELPFKYWQVRDVRTMLDFHQRERLDAPSNFIEHHPLHDAAWDAAQMVFWSQQ